MCSGSHSAEPKLTVPVLGPFLGKKSQESDCPLLVLFSQARLLLSVM